MKKAKAWWSAISTKTKKELCKEFFGHSDFIDRCNPVERDNYTARLFEWHIDREKRIKKEAASLTKWLKTQSINIRFSSGRVNKQLNFGTDHNFHVIANKKIVLKTKNAIEAIKKYESI